MNLTQIEDSPRLAPGEADRARAYVERTCPDDAPTILQALGLVSYGGKATHRTLTQPVDVERYGWTS